MSRRDSAYTKAVREAGLRYIGRGWRVVPLKEGAKRPAPADWPSPVIRAEDVEKAFRTGEGIGVLLGAASGNLVDVDLDCPEAVRLAPAMLPETELRHGRPSAPRSHYFYELEATGETERITFAGETLVELWAEKTGGATGLQTMIPPSIHPDGEALAWDPEGAPARVAYPVLLAAVRRLAAGVLLVRAFSRPGGRHQVALAVGGVLARAGWPAPEAEAFVRVVAEAAGDDEVDDRLRAVADSFETVARGGPATGIPSLKALVGEEEARAVLRWLGVSEARPGAALAAESPYTVDPLRRYCLITGRRDDGSPKLKPLATFNARIVEQVIVDDGETRSRAFRLEGEDAAGRFDRIARVEASAFEAMRWPSETWGARATILAGTATRDHVRAAILLTSRSGDGEAPPERVVYSHTGWRRIGEAWHYLTGSGAIGTDPVQVETELDSGLERYRLPVEPPPAAELEQAVRTSLRFLEVANLEASAMLLGSVVRAPLCVALPVDFMPWLAGKTQVRKSSLAAVALCHFGDFPDKAALPIGWNSTAAAILKRANVLKDAVTVVDDYAPQSGDRKRLLATASEVVRAIGNSAGRERLRADLTARKSTPPRGVVIATGESFPDAGESALARLFVVELERGAVDLDRLTEAQKTSGVLPLAMAGFVRWLAPKINELRRGAPGAFVAERNRLRSRVDAASYARPVEACAHLVLGLRVYFQYAKDAGALTEAEAGALLERCEEALIRAAGREAALVLSERPVKRVLSVVADLLANGTFFVKDGKDPSPLGKSDLGWYDRDWLYLLPAPTFDAVRSRMEDRRLPVDEATLRVDLIREGLAESDERGGALKKKRFGLSTVRVLMVDRKRAALMLGHDVLGAELEREPGEDDDKGESF